MPGKYHLIFERVSKADSSLIISLDTIVARIPAAQRPKLVSAAPIARLIKLFCDVSRIDRLLATLGYDSKDGSIMSKINKSVLDEAYEKLRAIGLLVDERQLVDAKLNQQHTLKHQIEHRMAMSDGGARPSPFGAAGPFSMANGDDENEGGDDENMDEDGEGEDGHDDDDDGGDDDEDMDEDGEDEDDDEGMSSRSRKKKSAKKSAKKSPAAAAPVAAAAAPAAAAPAPVAGDIAAIDALIVTLTTSKASIDAQLVTLTNQYYELVPQPGRHRSAIRAITTKAEVQAHVTSVLQFVDLHVTSKILLGSQLKSAQMHPVDYAYAGLGVSLARLSPRSSTHELLSAYVYATSQGPQQLEIYNIFDLARKDEEGRDEKMRKIGNRKLLWHGSGLCNFNGILSAGLRIAPPEAAVAGYAFGKGIYFADSFAKSYDYCRDNEGSYGGSMAQSSYNRYGQAHVDTNGVKALLLCEVALGRMHPAHAPDYRDAAAPGTDSTWGIGTHAPDAPRVRVTDDGVQVPATSMVPVHVPDDWKPSKVGETYHAVPNNEFIIFDESHCRMRYLVQVGPPRARYLARLARRSAREVKNGIQ